MLRTRHFLAAGVCFSAIAVAVSGCQSWNSGTGIFSWRGNGYDDQVNALTRDLRPPGDERQFSGLDSRARDIEQSLGVR